MLAPKICLVCRLLVTALACAILVCSFSLQLRYAAVLAGLFPGPEADAYASPVATIGSQGTIQASYSSEVVTSHAPSNSSGLTSTTLMWNDAWFAGNPRVYNHDIATASTVLSAISNSESQFYGSVENATPYAEQALAQLGFENIETSSYALRSDLLDQLGALFTGSHDVAAYTFAFKTLTDTKGRPQGKLIFVGIRGSYGIEWLSNLKFSQDGEETTDHYGFSTTKQEVMKALSLYVKQVGAGAETTKFLITGHSRGGSIANLVAAELSRSEGTSISSAANTNVYAYTFAAPRTTLSPEREDARYAHIFNIVNPADIVPQLPLAAWGYGHYGTQVSLPDADDAQFSLLHSGMQTAFCINTGYASPSNTAALNQLDTFGAQAGHSLPSMENLLTPSGMIAAGQTLIDIDLDTALTSHYPDAYIAWMQSIDPQALSFS